MSRPSDRPPAPTPPLQDSLSVLLHSVLFGSASYLALLVGAPFLRFLAPLTLRYTYAFLTFPHYVLGIVPTTIHPAFNFIPGLLLNITVWFGLLCIWKLWRFESGR